MPHEQALRSLRLFAERVMPAFAPAGAVEARPFDIGAR
jgi:hypothetical protein